MATNVNLPKPPKPRELCPRCYAVGVENDLIYSKSSRTGHSCPVGHTWEDRGDVSAREILGYEITEMNKKRRALEPPKPVAPQIIPEIPNDTRIKIDPIDKERIESLLGPFGDSSELFGKIFAFNEQMKDARELAERAQARIAVSQVRTVGGDYPMTYNVPERHVQPIKDVAESGGMSIERYLQAGFDNALDNMWLY